MALYKWDGPQRFGDETREVLRSGRKVTDRRIFRGDVVDLDEDEADRFSHLIQPVEAPEPEEVPEEKQEPEPEPDADEPENEPEEDSRQETEEEPEEEPSGYEPETEDGGEEYPSLEEQHERGWPLSRPAEYYLERYPDGPNAELAREVLGLDSD